MARNQVCLFVSLHLTVILLSNYYVLSTASDVREAAPHEDVFVEFILRRTQIMGE